MNKKTSNGWKTAYALGWDECYRFTSVSVSSAYSVVYQYDVLNRHVSRIAGVSPALTECYVYNGNQIVADLDGSGNSIANQQSAIGNRYTFQGREIDWATGLYYFRARWYDPNTGRWLSKDPIGIFGGLNLYVFCGNNPVNFMDPFGQKADVVFAPETDGLYKQAMLLSDAGSSEITVVGEGIQRTHTSKASGSEVIVGYSYKYQYGYKDTTTLTPLEVANAIKALSDYDPKATIYMYICYGNKSFNKELSKLLPNPIRGHDGILTRLFPKENMKCPNE